MIRVDPSHCSPPPPRPGNSSWAHLNCALWIPEVRVGNVEKMEPITNVEAVPVSQEYSIDSLNCLRDYFLNLRIRINSGETLLPIEPLELWHWRICQGFGGSIGKDPDSNPSWISNFLSLPTHSVSISWLLFL